MIDTCRELAESDIPSHCAEPTHELSGDDRLFTALVAGCHVKDAATDAGISERTAYRRLADPEFKSRIVAAREGLRESILAKLADAGDDAIGALRGLLVSKDENIKLKAAKTLLDSLMNVQATAPKESTDEPVGRVVVFLPDDGREPEATPRIREIGGIVEL